MEFLKRFVHRPYGTVTDCHGATLVESGDGTLLCAWYAGPEDKPEEVAIYGASLAPGELEWTQRGVFADTPGLAEGNPVLFLDARDRLWLFYVTRFGDRWDTCQVKYAHSRDSGRTWGEPNFLRSDWGWMTGCKPLLRPNGVILLPLYEENGTAFVLRSEEGGLYWESSNMITTEQGVIEPSVAPLSDGSLLMYLRTYEPSGGTIWQSVSTDEGRMWAEPTRTCLPNPNARVDLTALASGRLALAFNDTPEGRSPLTLALSEDEGKTWSYRVNVETEAFEFAYPTLIQAQDGLLHLAYTWRRTHIAHVACDEEYLLAHGRN
jgi:predicted neuraminidase